MKEYSVFISYSRKDDINYLNDSQRISPIDQILNRFKEEGIKPWIDREGKYCGATFQKEIARALDNSELVLFISSANSNSDDARWVFCEVNYAADKKIKILPLLLDDTPFNDEIKLIFSGKDRNEYYKNPTKGLNDLVGSIKKHIENVRRKEKAEAEEAERRLKEEKERERIKKIEKEIATIKKRIVDYVEKQQSCLKDLLSKEKELNNNDYVSTECPVCKNPIIDTNIDFCDICGWHFATPKELISSEMQQMYDDRLYASQTIWNEKQQRRKEIETLRKEKDSLIDSIDIKQKEFIDYKTKCNDILESNKKQIKIKDEEINRLKKKLNDINTELLKANKIISESAQKKVNEEKKIQQRTQPIAFLLVTEFDMTNVYCLYEGENIFGSMQANKNNPKYQMLVMSNENLCPQHFIILAKKDNKNFLYSVTPYDENSIVAINSQSNIIKGESYIHINDVLFVGEVKIRIVDNFNK